MVFLFSKKVGENITEHCAYFLILQIYQMVLLTRWKYPDKNCWGLYLSIQYIQFLSPQMEPDEFESI